MLTIRRSEDRGPANHGWLRSRHTFSFGSYHDPRFMGVSALRVINDDQVTPGHGFSTHSHRDMEIISYVKRGSIEHKDSMGNVESLPAGEFQLMSAGTGVTHSEYNPSQTEPLEFLQIWIEPNVHGIEPGYQQKKFENQQGLQLIISPDGRDESLQVHQDTYLYELQLLVETSAEHKVKKDRTTYVHVVSGSLTINGEQLNEGDGVTVSEVEKVSFLALDQTAALVFDLP